MAMMNAPEANLLRFGQVQLWSGLPARTLEDIIGTGRLGGARLWEGSRRYFLREIARHVLFGAPLPSSPFGAEPEPELLRVWDVLAWTGLREDQFRWCERHGLGGGFAIRTDAKRLYPKHLIRTHFFEPLLPAGWGNS